MFTIEQLRALREVKDFKEQPTQDAPGYALRVNTYNLPGSGDTFSIDIWGIGFEVTRMLQLDDLEAIRDWCAKAIAAHNLGEVA